MLIHAAECFQSKQYCNPSGSGAKAKFLIMTNSEKVSRNKWDIDGQPDIAIWPTKTEVLISPKV